MTYATFINHVLGRNDEYLANIRLHDDLMTYLRKYNSEDSLPLMKSDRNLLSFSNGVLCLSTQKFHLYAVPLPDYIVGRVARHHIPCLYTGSTDTPLMDRILRHQFEEGDGRIEQLFAMIGRTFFKIRERDSWDVMAMLLGERKTGKSTILAIIAAMFNPASVGEIEDNRFGLQKTYNKELVLIRDAPAKISKILSQEVFQKMVCGERINVKIKYNSPIACIWSTPLFMESDTMMDYDDGRGQISRRVVIFRFEKLLSPDSIDPTLSERIITTELPNIVARCLQGN